MQIPIVSGIYTDNAAQFRTSYPINMVPVPTQQGISAGYLRPADGVVQNGATTGTCRGQINYEGVLYRVMGANLVRVDAAGGVTVIGNVGGTSQATLTYSFDYLAVASDNKLFLYDGTTLAQVTDPDLGTVLDVIWVDGYFMTTDGTNLVVTELTDPFAVNPLKYGSSEVDPDPVVAVLKLRNEVHALNRYTIEVFRNVGGDLFPFQRVTGGQIQRGCVGTHACTIYQDTVAFIGGARDESPSVYQGANGSSVRIATNEIDEILMTYTEAQLAQSVIEARTDKAHRELYIYLPNHTLVYDAAASAALQQPVWYSLCSNTSLTGPWDACGLCWAYDKWTAAHRTSGQLGYLTSTISSHWGNVIKWQFGTPIVYNEGMGAIFHEVELVALTGRIEVGKDPFIGTEYSFDGMAWSQEKVIRAGTTGDRLKRLVWMQQGSMRNWRLQRFTGSSDARVSVVRIEARIEPLAF